MTDKADIELAEQYGAIRSGATIMFSHRNYIALIAHIRQQAQAEQQAVIVQMREALNACASHDYMGDVRETVSQALDLNYSSSALDAIRKQMGKMAILVEANKEVRHIIELIAEQGYPALTLLVKQALERLDSVAATSVEVKSYMAAHDAEVLETAENKFDGISGYNFMCAERYANALDIADELRYMAAELRNSAEGKEK